MKNSSIIKDTAVLFFITVSLVAVLSIVKVITQPLIDAANIAAEMEAYTEVCNGFNSGESIKNEVVGAGAGYNASLLPGENAVLRCKNNNDEYIGYIVKVTSKGYGGPINLIVGFDIKGNVTGIRFADTLKETPGLGMKIKEKKFLDTWFGVNSDTVESVDTISGATISSTAFREAMLLACMYANRAVTMYGGN